MDTTAPPPDDRKARALAFVAQYRGTHPSDARSDDDLLRAPYGGYELADLVGDEAASIPERRRHAQDRLQPGAPPLRPRRDGRRDPRLEDAPPRTLPRRPLPV